MRKVLIATKTGGERVGDNNIFLCYWIDIKVPL